MSSSTEAARKATMDDILPTTPADATPLRNRKIAATAILVVTFWIATFAILSIRGALVGELPIAVIGPRRALLALFGAVLCGAISWLVASERRRSFSGRMVLAVVASLVTAGLMTVLHIVAYRYIAPLPGVRPVTWLEGLWWSTLWLGYALGWTGTYLALTYHWEAQERERALADARLLAQEARLAALRAHIHPHFLFNTLNSISASVLGRDVAAAERMLQNLANFFRATLVNQSAETVNLADEIALQRLYLEIEAERFQDRMDVTFDVPDALSRVQVPALLLQPLVENAVRHGVEGTNSRVSIAVRASAVGGQLSLHVEDDAPGGARAGGMGIGLDNISNRLAIQYGRAAGLSAGPLRGGGYRASIAIPLGPSE